MKQEAEKGANKGQSNQCAQHDANSADFVMLKINVKPVSYLEI